MLDFQWGTDIPDYHNSKLCLQNVSNRLFVLSAGCLRFEALPFYITTFALG